MFQFFRPSPALRPCVEGIWVYDLDGLAAEYRLMRVPDPFSYVCFVWGDEVNASHGQARFVTRTGITGFQMRRVELLTRGRLAAVTVRFSAWGASRFLPGPAEDYAGARVEGRAALGVAAVERLEAQLAEACGARQCADLVETFLLARMRPERDPLVRVIAMTASAGPLASVGEIARRCAVSERTLARRFRAEIGVGPKRFLRVMRMHRALAAYAPGRAWADVAASAGYADQAHFNHDCLDLCGLSPQGLMRSLTPGATQGVDDALREGRTTTVCSAFDLLTS